MSTRTVATAAILGSVCLLGACAGHRIAPPYEGTMPAATGPDGARKWRRLAWADEHGHIRDDALRTALEQRDANAGFWKAKAIEQGFAAPTIAMAGMNPGAFSPAVTTSGPASTAASTSSR